MADNVSKAERSRIMARVRSKDTKPEMVVRRIVHGLGFRYRLHVRSLPGTPDVVLTKHRKVIEVRGCFWHMHPCGRCRIPATRRDEWIAKLHRNAARDQAAIRKLRWLKWRVLVVWECETKNVQRLAARIKRFLES